MSIVYNGTVGAHAIFQESGIRLKMISHLTRDKAAHSRPLQFTFRTTCNGAIPRKHIQR